MEYRIPREGHPPRHDILGEVRTLSRREIADVGPEIRTHGDGRSLEDQEIEGASWGTTIFRVSRIDDQLAERCRTGIRIIADDTIENSFDRIAVLQWEVLIEDFELLSFTDVLRRAQCVLR